MNHVALALVLTVGSAAPAFAGTFDEPLQAADMGLLKAINQAHAPALDAAAAGLSNSALLFGVPLATGYAASGHWGLPLQVFEAQLVGGALSTGLKFAIDRPRPFVTDPGIRLPLGPEILPSFPSGHATVSFAGATALALNEPALAVPGYAWAALVSYSRLYAGVHYPTDVLAGALLGVGSAAFTHWALADLNARLGAGRPPLAPPVSALTWSTGF